jgi:RNA polymerase sigma-70 factor (ECF subfamily)
MQFEAVYRAHFAAVWRTLRRLGVAHQDAPDAAQQVFVIAYRRRDGFEGRSTVKTWLLGIAYRVAADRRRRAPERREVLDAEAVTDLKVDPQPELEQRELIRLLDGVLDTLPLEQRAVFTMFEMEGLTGEEIATALSLPLGTVRSRLRLARQAFCRAAEQLPPDVRAVLAGGKP